jgi:thiopeptide-type bacteriocin biosynthesis protein
MTEDNYEWMQVSCSLFPEIDRQPHIPWEPLSEAVRAWRAKGLISRFWFVRKPPGLRLRFQGPAIGARLQGPLALWLTEGEWQNAIRGFRFTIYEPEVRRFGGPAGMDLAHTLFDVGSTLALNYQTMPQAVTESVTALELSLAGTSDLLERCLGDRAEVWDVWSALGDAIGALKTPADDPTRRRWDAAIRGLKPLREAVAQELAPTLASVEQTHIEVAAQVRALADAGTLRVGLRAWLAAVVVFDWNRLGLPDKLERLAQAVSYVTQVLAPGARSDGPQRY